MSRHVTDRSMFCRRCGRPLENHPSFEKRKHADTVTATHDLATDKVTLVHDQCNGEAAFSRRSLA